jgi:hypothetical protein
MKPTTIPTRSFVVINLVLQSDQANLRTKAIRLHGSGSTFAEVGAMIRAEWGVKTDANEEMWTEASRVICLRDSKRIERIASSRRSGTL